MSFGVVHDSCKINAAVELREDTENNLYKTDFLGHLQLVNAGEDIQFPSTIADRSRLDHVLEWKSDKSTLQASNSNHNVLMYQGESLDSVANRNNMTLRNKIKVPMMINYSEKEVDKDCSYGCIFPKSPLYSPRKTLKRRTHNFSHPTLSKQNLTEAEKKKQYRMRLKSENPSLWSSMKEKEAARKRELRGKRKSIISDMQKALEITSSPDSPEYSEQCMYLEALKERYPDIYNQLLEALPETEKRNERLFYESSSRNKGPKPMREYKDVIQAQKKRLYRQRLKEERPEVYEIQKTKNSYAKSIQRFIMKSENSVASYYRERQFSYVNMSNIQPSNPPTIKSEYTSLHQAIHPVHSKIGHSNRPLAVSPTEGMPPISFPPSSGAEASHNTVGGNSTRSSFQERDREHDNYLPSNYFPSNNAAKNNELNPTNNSTTQSNIL